MALGAGASDRLDAARAGLDFEPLLPCAFRDDLEVVEAFADRVAGAPAAPAMPRLHLVVERRGERGFVLSQTRAGVPFTAIPQGTHRLRAGDGAVVASGFAGPSGGGDEIAYLRWRVAGVTFELAATLRPWLDERDVVAIARAMISRAEGTGAPR